MGTPDVEQVRCHLQRVLASAEFAKAPRLARFLTFIVETALSGKGEAIKESLIALEVYRRPPGANPQNDTAVRVDARRLRQRLEQYYREGGQGEALRIEVPKGGYVPVFRPISANLPPVPPVVPEASRPRRRLAAVSGGLLLCACAALSLHISRRSEPKVDPQTTELYQRAQDLLRIPVQKNGPPEKLPESVLEAVHLFREVTRRCPTLAKGWTGLAEAAEWEFELRGNQPRERLAEARAAAKRAVELGPDSVEAWTILSSISLYREWDLAAARAACRRILELDPRNLLARQRYIDILRVQGLRAEAAAEIEKAAKLLPAAAGIRVRRAMMLYEEGRCDQALAEARAAGKLTNTMPLHTITLWVEGLCLEQQSRFAEAERVFRLALAHQPHDLWNEPALGHLLARMKRYTEARAVLSELESQVARHRPTYVSQALIHTASGNKEQALRALQTAWENRDDAILWVASDPRLRPLRNDPRFQEIIAKLRRAG